MSVSDEFDQDREQEEPQGQSLPQAFQRLYREYSEGRIPQKQAFDDLLSILAGEEVARHAEEDAAEPEGVYVPPDESQPEEPTNPETGEPLNFARTH